MFLSNNSFRIAFYVKQYIINIFQSFELDFTLTQEWTDSRLNTSSFNTDYLVLDEELISKLWTPDIVFQNAFSVEVVEMNQNSDFMVIDRNKCVTHSIRMYGNFACQMDLINFPQDFQYCSIEIISCKLFKENETFKFKN